MQPNVVQPNNIEIVSNSFDWINQIPPEIASLLPQNVWVSLTLDQKKEVLRQHQGLFEKYVGGVTAPEQASIVDAQTVTTESVVVEQVQKKEVNPEFEKAINEFKSEQEKPSEKNPVLTEEEIARINTESNNQGSYSNYKFFGYQPSSSTASNASSISDNGNIADSKTWAATLLSKIFQVFGE